ncbi:NAD(P)H-dependent oxidoreductase [Bdellovibrio sp.]|uniref:flavodoxin family protein n=1 Tax=Bdellovibrio TaxID=958 RepID=UPI003221A57C
MKKILVLNGSPSGDKGNCALWIKALKKLFPKTASLDVIHLASSGYGSSLKKKITDADAMIFVTGTYWDSWGSPLQKLLEQMTDLEGTEALMGKPVAVFVLMHSVGGKGILSRLQGVLSTMGFLIPPMSGMVYSLVSDIALKSPSSHAKDFWQKEDAELIVENLLKACDLNVQWAHWPVDKKDPRRKWLRS